MEAKGCVILTHTDLASALHKAELFRKVIETYPFPKGESQPLGKVSVSIGVSEYPSHASSTELLIKLADDALYRELKRNLAISLNVQKKMNRTCLLLNQSI